MELGLIIFGDALELMEIGRIDLLLQQLLASKIFIDVKRAGSKSGLIRCVYHFDEEGTQIRKFYGTVRLFGKLCYLKFQ